ncbi:MAG: nucleotidyltransferase domain-containing protein [Candidatus Electrothrix scaldis]|nr:MAG: nucleotidyltransferase domain-containing protein [Candidatus Electrothrix sp. GW3-3]
METNSKELQQILDHLKAVNLHKVILFGSVAKGQQHEHSDIDLLVVTDDEFFPKNYQEKSELYLKVSETLTEVAGRIPIDLIVFTKSMYQRFVQLGSLFSKEILQHGIILYETDHARMAGQSQR